MGLELKDKILGVVGAGAIGGRVAEIGLGFGMKVVYFSRTTKSYLDERGAEKKELNKVLSRSDFVSLNLVLKNETKHIISKEKIDLLKDQCVFINLAPPHLINEKAMMKACKANKLTFIFDHSDDSEYTKDFLKISNCVVYPPVAFRTKQADINRWEAFAGNIEEFIAGKPQNVVN